MGREREERHATWLELFFDLVFAAAIFQVGDILNHDFTGHGLMQFVIILIPICSAWTGIAFYATRFDTDDLSDRILSCLQMIGVAALAVNAHHALGASSIGFAGSFAFIRLIQVLQYLLASIFVPEARALTGHHAAGFALTACLWLASVWVPMPQRFILWGVALSFDFIEPLIAGKLHLHVPIHHVHISERYGLFILVVLGEAVMGAIGGMAQREYWHLLSALCAILGLLMAFCFWWLYFDHASMAPAPAAKDEQKRWIYQVWLYAHFPLIIALSATGLAIGKVVLASQRIPLPEITRWVLCGGVALSFLSIGIVHLTASSYGHPIHMRAWLPYLISVLVVLGMAWLLSPMVWPFVWCLLLAAVCIFNVVMHIFLDRQIAQLPVEFTR
jgi:low temperature requirement protein LtrA